MYIILPHSKAQRTSQPRVQELETECCEAVSFGHDAVIATQDSTVVACTKTRQKNSSNDGGRAHKDASLEEKLLAFNGFWGNRVSFLQQYGTL